MAATSGSSASATPYDVFLSFRGPDTRNTFTNCLYQTMVSQGIDAYIDKEELQVGDRIDDLLRAIENSKICIPVLSRGYASSPWCLRELARATELNESTGKPEILPIFFNVTPSDVKLRTELYVEGLEENERRYGGQIRQQWEAALRKVAGIKGWEVEGKPYDEFIDLVVNKVMRKLKVKQRPLDSKPIGVDKQVEAIMKLLDVDSGTGVRFVGIHGMGGIGKTTLAKIVFNELCLRFDGQCSFIGNIRESSNRNGLIDLQKQLASDIFCSRFVENFINTDEGIERIRRRAGSKKVLIVLDDLDKKEQLKKLVGGPETFGSGSRIIITTRDKGILNKVEGILAYEAKEMDPDKALELFSLHAFGTISPPETHRSFSREVVSTTGGLPLALEVIGSYLHEKKEEIWEEMLQKLKNVPHDEVQEKLKISYDALSFQEKEIFLDIACFFINRSLLWPTYFWGACNLYPHCSLERLTDLSLIKIDGDDNVWMHDQLRDLGIDIVRTQNLTEPRLWIGEEALEVVRSKERKGKVKALDLSGYRPNPIYIGDEELERMPNLKFLELYRGTFVGDVTNCLRELRWLCWSFPPLDCRMANLHLENLVVFKLNYNENTENWGGWNILKMANKLKVLSLYECKGLEKTPDFSGCLRLKILSLRNCCDLQEVDSSIGKLKHLTHLDLGKCICLQNLPEEIGELVNLEHFSIDECREIEKLPFIEKLTSLSKLVISRTKIKRLPDSIGDAKHLSFLDLSFTFIEELPNSIGKLTKLEFLSLNACPLRKLPKSIGNLTSLQELHLSKTNIVELPKSVGNLTSLRELDLSETDIVELPDSIKDLKQLNVLRMGSSKIRRLPVGIGMLEKLEKLNAKYCEQLAGELSTEIGKLSSLRIIEMSYTGVCKVPTEINSLTQLQKLDLTSCNELQELPELPSSLICLYVESTSLRLVPDLSNLKNLVRLLLSNGSGQALAQTSSPMQSLHLQWVGKLSKLADLNLCLSNIPVPSTELSYLRRLRELTLSSVDSFNSVVVGPQFSTLTNLYRLCLHRSPLGEIQLDGLELLRFLKVTDCELLGRLSIISSSLRELQIMEVRDCPKLLEIRFLGAMESLKRLRVESCDSLGGLCGLSNLKKLVNLTFRECPGLRVVEGLKELELLAHLNLIGRTSTEWLTDVSNSKIPNECHVSACYCPELPDIGNRRVSYGHWKEMILDRMRKTLNESPPQTTSSDVSKCSCSIL